MRRAKPIVGVAVLALLLTGCAPYDDVLWRQIIGYKDPLMIGIYSRMSVIAAVPSVLYGSTIGLEDMACPAKLVATLPGGAHAVTVQDLSG